MSLLLLTEDELRQIITMAEAIEAVKGAFVALAENRVNTNFFTLNLPEVRGAANVKAAYLEEAPYYFVNVSSHFADNPSINLPVESGLMAVFDAATGFPAALLIDKGYLTQLRAGATGALAAAYLARQNLTRVAVLGSGSQAYMQLKALLVLRQIESVSVWGRSPLNVDSYARQVVEDHDLDVEIAPSIEAAVRDADLIITATASQEPLLRAEWLKPGVHISAAGSNSPAKQELYPDVLRRADVIVADSYEQAAARGEIFHGLATGAITPADIQGELGDLVIGKIPGRTHPDQITLADLTGLEVLDTALAAAAIQKAHFLGLGQRVANPL